MQELDWRISRADPVRIVREIGQQADRLAIQRHARSYKEVRFRHQGRSREFGIDCMGLPLVVAWDMGWNYPDYHSYSRSPNWPEAFLYLDKYLRRISPSDIEIGDISLFDDGAPHGGIFVDGGSPFNIVHSSALGRRKVIENIYDQSWRVKLRAAYRFKELCD